MTIDQNGGRPFGHDWISQTPLMPEIPEGNHGNTKEGAASRADR